jgi:hypothetical protein
MGRPKKKTLDLNNDADYQIFIKQLNQVEPKERVQGRGGWRTPTAREMNKGLDGN